MKKKRKEKQEKKNKKLSLDQNVSEPRDWDQLMLIGNNQCSMEHANRFFFVVEAHSARLFLFVSQK